MDALTKDLRYALRSLGKNRAFAAVAILTLGLGIGANTAIFSAISGVLLKPLPYAESDRLVLIRQSAPLAGVPDTGVSIKEYFDYREQSPDFESLVEYHNMSFDLLRRGEPDRVSTGVVSHNFFDVLGITPILGRTFVADDDRPGADAVLIISYGYWQSRFAADPGIVGQVFQMNDRPHTVIGVLPQVPLYPREDDVYMPVLACPFRAAAEQNIAQNRRTFSILNVFGRLKPGVAQARAESSVDSICGNFTKADTKAYRPDSGFSATTVLVRDGLTANARPMLFILLGTTGLVLLLACANVASLTLARLLRRDRELALRTALGAARSRIVRQLLTESTLVALAGGLLGILFASVTIDLLARFVGRFTQRTGEIHIDPWVLLFTLVVSVMTGLVFGVVPAISSRVDLVNALKQGSKGSGAGSDGRRLQRGLVVAQVALSVVLLVGAGLLIMSVYRLQQVDPGYRAEGVLSAETFGNFSKYPNVDALLKFYLPLLDRLEGQPGVVSAAVTNAVPLSATQPGNLPFDIEGRATDNPDRRPTTDLRIASTRLFETLRVRLLQGRLFQETDDREAGRVVVINRSMTRYWDGTDPIGTRISFNNGQTWSTVVGVVDDVRQFGLEREAVSQVYVPLRQAPFGLAGRVLVRTIGDPVRAASLVREAVRALDADMPIENVRTLTELRDEYLSTPRLTALLLSVFALLALVVTLAGMTGVIATSVSQRTQEFGLRMALGASRERVLRLVIGQGLVLVAIGLAVGLAAALALGRVLGSYLFATEPADPVTLAAVSLLLLAAGAAACAGPAWRATTVDPMTALRAE